MKNKLISILIITTVFMSVLLGTGVNTYAAISNTFEIGIGIQNPRVGNAYFDGEKIEVIFTLENGFYGQKNARFTYSLVDGVGNVVESFTEDVTFKTKQKLLIGYTPDFDKRYGVYTITATLSEGSYEVTDTVKFSYTKKQGEFLDELGYMCHLTKPDNQGEYARLEKSEKLLKESGAAWIREGISWSDVEKIKGKYEVPEIYDKFIDSAIANGQKVILCVSGGNALYETGEWADGSPYPCLPTNSESRQAFANYCAFIARYF